MRCVEKIKIARFRFDNHTIKRGKRALHYSYLVPLVSSNIKICLAVSDGKVKTFVKSVMKANRW